MTSTITQTTDNIIDRDVLQDKYVQRVIDSLDLDDCLAMLYDYINKDTDSLSLNELIEDVQEYYPELLEWPPDYQYKYPVLCHFSIKKGLLNVY